MGVLGGNKNDVYRNNRQIRAFAPFVTLLTVDTEPGVPKRRPSRWRTNMAAPTNKTNNRSPLTQALKACYPALGTTFVLSMFINAAMLASPLYSMQVYDRVLTSRNVS